MREAHREAARILYEDRNRGSDDAVELYVDLHGKLTPLPLPVFHLLILLQAFTLMNQYRISKAFS
jgi:hypothetical protein